MAAGDAGRLISLLASGLLHAALLWAVATATGLRPGSDAGAAPPARTVTVVVAPPEDATFPGLKPVDRKPQPAFDRHYSPLALEGSTFDLDTIARRARVLFPFVSPGVLLELFRLRPDDSLQWLQDAAASKAGAPRPAPPLALAPAAIQALVDRTWSRRARWTAVQPILGLADTRDASAGALPLVLRSYAEQNMGQYFQDRTTLATNQRLWAELSVAADHASFIGYIRRYAAAHPSTRATTELLFLLDKVAESNRNVLDTLLSIEPAELYHTRVSDSRAYELVVGLRNYYRGRLSERGLDSRAAITAFYDAARLEILQGILRTTPSGYRANDARLLIGAIDWRSGHGEAALASWCGMTLDETDAYVETYGRILDALRSSGPGPCAASRADLAVRTGIDRILDQDAEQAWDFQFHRLWQFGYRFETF